MNTTLYFQAAIETMVRRLICSAAYVSPPHQHLTMRGRNSITALKWILLSDFLVDEHILS